MISAKFLMGRGRELLSNEDRLLIENNIIDVREVPARQLLTRCGDPVQTSMLLLDGFVGRYVGDWHGRRQLAGMVVPGDFVDLHGFTVKRLDHDVATIGPVKIAVYEHEALTVISERSPHIARVLWSSTLLDAAMHRNWIFRLGRLGAREKIGHLFCELAARLDMVGLVHGGCFALPMTQLDVAEATGLTCVHTNRVLRTLREGGLLKLQNRFAQILNDRILSRMCEFDPMYLYQSDKSF